MCLSFDFEPLKRDHFLGPNETNVDEREQVAYPEVGEESSLRHVYNGWIGVILS
jgi:hypothetical protein